MIFSLSIELTILPDRAGEGKMGRKSFICPTAIFHNIAHALIDKAAIFCPDISLRLLLPCYDEKQTEEK